MSILKEIKDYIFKEYRSLYKSQYRPRSLQGIETKQNLLNENLEEFSSTLEALEDKISIAERNRLTDDFEAIKTKVALCLKILEKKQQLL